MIRLVSLALVVLASPSWAADDNKQSTRCWDGYADGTLKEVPCAISTSHNNKKTKSWLLVITHHAECNNQSDRPPTIYPGLSRNECIRVLYTTGIIVDPSKVRRTYPVDRTFPFISNTLRSCSFVTSGSCTDTETGETANDLRDDNAQAAP